MATHRLDGDAQFLGELSRSDLPLAQHQGQGGFARWSLSGGAHGQGIMPTPCHAGLMTGESTHRRCWFCYMVCGRGGSRGPQWAFTPAGLRVP